MQITTATIDIAGSGPRPEYLLERQNQEPWIVARDPLVPDPVAGWHQSRDGQYVQIPLVPYRTAADPLSVIHFVSTLWVSLGTLWPETKRWHMVYGAPLEVIEENGVHYHRFWLGLARVP